MRRQHLRLDTFKLFQNGPRPIDQMLSGLRRCQAAAITFKELRVQLDFKQPNLATERGLHQPQPSGRLLQAADLGHDKQRLQLAQVHDEPLEQQ